MNERIQELIEKATTVEKGPPNYDLTCNIMFEHFDKEKFAELIVKACIGILRDREEGLFSRAASNLIASIRSDECHIMADEIEKHFGIK